MQNPKVAIIGAGVIGLSTAVCIQDLMPNCHVTIISDTFSPNTTSDGSGGYWHPYALSQTDPELIRDVGTSTYRYLKDLAQSSEAGVAGVQLVSGYIYEEGKSVDEDDQVKGMVDDYRKLTPQELQEYPGYSMGCYFTTPIVDVTSYLNWLMLRFTNKGGTVIRRKIKSMEELAGKWSVVVNCCGLGAVELLNDIDMYPIRGQIMRVDAPWIKHFYNFNSKHGDDDSYVLPGVGFVVVGGTAQKGDWNTDVDVNTEKEIWDRAVRRMPQLTHAKKIRSWAGLRPARTTLRLEQETFGHGHQAIHVVHNYGHGGAGVTLHWGCAQKAAALVNTLLLSPSAGTNAHNYNKKPSVQSKI